MVALPLRLSVAEVTFTMNDLIHSAAPSILFPDPETGAAEQESSSPPEHFADLFLDQVINTILAQKQTFHLEPIYYQPLQDTRVLKYRQDIFRDLEDQAVLAVFNTFSERMMLVRRYLGMIEKLYYKYHQAGWVLEAADLYCQAVNGLAEDLNGLEVHSEGLLGIWAYLKDYVAQDAFLKFQATTRQVKEALSTVQYSMIIKGITVRVQKYNQEADFSREVVETFEKFKQVEAKPYRIDKITAAGMNHVKALVLDCVARLYPDVFSQLEAFYTAYAGFEDPGIANFYREIQFYLSYLAFIENIKFKGLKFCYPDFAVSDKHIQAQDAFDIALANKVQFESTPVVTNSFHLSGKERIIIVSGPNQGGKTTFSRMFGQLHYLASIGCPVPGKKARLFLSDRIFTHFEKQEDIRNLRGKLQDDLVRIHEILKQATPRSIIILNEIFSSTTLSDAIFLSQEIMKQIIQLDALCVCVSFIDELSRMGEQTVSMVSTVDLKYPTRRTFKIIRKQADGLAYAVCIAEKHRLTYEILKERLAK